MGFGKVAVRIALDDPKCPRSGPDDPITGAVILTYTIKPGWSDIVELFGPLRIDLRFSGEAVTRIFNKSTQVRQINEGRLSLFQQNSTIHDGKCTLQANVGKRFPLDLRLPERSDISQWRPNATFDTQRILPPSFETSFSGFSSRFEAVTEYKLSAEVVFPGIDVEVYNAVDFVPIIYTPPPMLPQQVDYRSVVLKDRFRIQNEQLLFEEVRPKGFFQKFKAAFNPGAPFPIWQADVTITVPQHVYLEHEIVLDVALRPTVKNYAEISPDIYLDLATVTITASTFVRAKGPREDHLAEGGETIATYNLRSVEPFSKRADYSKRIQTAPLQGFPGTFSTYNITRTYSMAIKIRLLGAGETMTVQKTLPIYIHSRVFDGVSMAVAGSSSSTAAAIEAVQLPEYKPPPPTYEDATATSGESSGSTKDAVRS